MRLGASYGAHFFFLLAAEIIRARHVSLLLVSSDSPATFIGAILGISLAIALALAFPIGYFGAFLNSYELFNWFNNKLFFLIRTMTFSEEVSEKSKRNPAHFLLLSHRFSKEYLEQLCGFRKKYGDEKILDAKDLKVTHRALWTALIVEIAKLFGSSFGNYKNYSLRENSFFKTQAYKKIIDEVYGDQIIQKILNTRNTFTVHISEDKEVILSAKEICESKLSELLESLQGPVDDFAKSENRHVSA